MSPPEHANEVEIVAPADEVEVVDPKLQDVQAKMKIVEDTIISLCQEDSKFADLRNMAAALKSGKDSLKIMSLSGGITNYSYKVSLASGDIALFAKICFEYALWNPDRSVKYELSRVDNEFQIMKDASLMEPSPVVTPYDCVNVVDSEGNKMKLLVTAWAPTDEQIVNQFIEGEVDRRVIEKIAKVLGTLNSKSDIDVHFNEDCRTCFRSVFHILSMVFDSYMDAPASDKYRALCHQMDKDYFKSVVDGFEASYMTQEVLCHGDPNIFNILVEPKPSIETLEQFGPTGDMVLCDWEMSFVGPRGKDVGWFQSFPIAAALSHAAHGHREETAARMFEHLVAFWDEYEKVLRASGRDDAVIRETYLSTLGWTGGLLLCYNMMGVHMNYIPTDDIPEAAKAKVLGSIGYIGFKLAELSFLKNENSPVAKMSLADLKKFYHDLVKGEIDELSLAGASQKARPHRASMLRTSGRRVSDAAVFETAALRTSVALTGSFNGMDIAEFDLQDEEN